MQSSFKTFGFLLLLFAIAGSLTYFYRHKPAISHTRSSRPTASVNNAAYLFRIKQKATAFKKLNAGLQYNSSYCFLIDMRIASGKKRFFVYNPEKDSIETSGLVTHGSGSDKGSSPLYFSNAPNSNCSSLGRYRIGNSYNGKFGLAFKLYGLDKTNSKAFERFVVLHAHGCVPDEETDPYPICKSWGCPTVSPNFLELLKTYIEKSHKPVMLWIYY